MDPGRSGQGDPELRKHTIAHEILHGLGRSHVDRDRFGKTIEASPRRKELNEPDILRALDEEGLQAVYSRFETGLARRHLAEELGAWEDTSTHLAGEVDGAQVAFGVAQRNGFVQPWADGPAPDAPLDESVDLAGEVVWRGRLLGMTPDARRVGGETRLAIDIGELAGQLKFTALEQWTGTRPMGEPGTGEPWHETQLAYDVRVEGNRFVRTGGDDGYLTGSFFEHGHRSMAGALRRTDLAAGFAGVRE